MIENFKITMPHRHTVFYEEEGLKVFHEVELLTNGVVIYKASQKIIEGDTDNLSIIFNRVLKDLNNRFKHVEIE